MRHPAVLLPTFALAAIASLPAAAQCGAPLLNEFGAPDPQASAFLGLSVATDGVTVVGGAPNADPAPANFHGAAYLWRKTAGVWSFETKIPGPTGPYRSFGRSVDVDGDLLVSGGFSGSFPYERAWVYRRSGGVWVQEAELLPNDPLGGGSNVPLAVGAEGDWAAIGHTRNSGLPVTSNFTGAVYLYRRSGGVWSQTAKLVPADALANDEIGAALDLEDGVLAFSSRVNSTSPGRVHVHRLAGGTATSEGTLTPPGPWSGKAFGHALATDGVRIAVADPSDTSVAGQLGLVHLYLHQAGAWVHETTVRPFVPSGTTLAFGQRVAIEGDDLVVGNTGLGNSARVWQFRRVNGQWLDLGLAGAPVTAGHGASALDLEGGALAVGSHNSTLGASQSGAVAVHDAAGGQLVCTHCTGKVNSLGCTPSLSWTGAPSASAGSGFVVRADGLIPGMGGLVIYGYDAKPPSAFQGGSLCLLSPIVRTSFQNSGGTSGCSGSIALDFNAWLASGADPLLGPGTTLAAQVWSRDLQSSFGSSVSNAIRFVYAP